MFDLGSTWTFTGDDWQTGRQTDGWEGGCLGMEEQSRVSSVWSCLECVNVTAGWKEAADTQSGAVSRLADCMIRAGCVEKMESQRKFVVVFVTNGDRESTV